MLNASPSNYKKRAAYFGALCVFFAVVLGICLLNDYKKPVISEINLEYLCSLDDSTKASIFELTALAPIPDDSLHDSKNKEMYRLVANYVESDGEPEPFSWEKLKGLCALSDLDRHKVDSLSIIKLYLSNGLETKYYATKKEKSYYLSAYYASSFFVIFACLSMIVIWVITLTDIKKTKEKEEKGDFKDSEMGLFWFAVAFLCWVVMDFLGIAQNYGLVGEDPCELLIRTVSIINSVFLFMGVLTLEMNKEYPFSYELHKKYKAHFPKRKIAFVGAGLIVLTLLYYPLKKLDCERLANLFLWPEFLFSLLTIIVLHYFLYYVFVGRKFNGIAYLSLIAAALNLLVQVMFFLDLVSKEPILPDLLGFFSNTYKLLLVSLIFALAFTWEQKYKVKLLEEKSKDVEKMNIVLQEKNKATDGMNKALEEKNKATDEMNKALEREKKQLISQRRYMNHALKGNLSNLMCFLEEQLFEMDSTMEGYGQIEDALIRVQIMEKLHDKIHNSQVDELPLNDFLGDVCDLLDKSLGFNGHLSHSIATNIVVPTASARKMAQIICELSINSSKHNKKMEQKAIHIDIGEDNDNVVVSFRDNAGGMEKSLFVNDGGIWSTHSVGFGHRFVLDTIQKNLKGRIACIDTKGKFTFEFEVPINKIKINKNEQNPNC